MWEISTSTNGKNHITSVRFAAHDLILMTKWLNFVHQDPDGWEVREGRGQTQQTWHEPHQVSLSIPLNGLVLMCRDPVLTMSIWKWYMNNIFIRLVFETEWRRFTGWRKWRKSLSGKRNDAWPTVNLKLRCSIIDDVILRGMFPSIRLEMKVTKSSGGVPRLSYTGRDDRHFLPTGLYIIKTVNGLYSVSLQLN